MNKLIIITIMTFVLQSCQWIPPPATLEGAYWSGAYAGCMRLAGELLGPLPAPELVQIDTLCDSIADELTPSDIPIGGPYFVPGSTT